MQLDEILSNEELRRHEFPVTGDKIFLAHAGVCPLPRRVFEAVQIFARDCTGADQEEVLPASYLRQTRQLAATMLGAQFEEIAFVGPTSLGLSYVASGLNFPKRENIVDFFHKFSSHSF